MEPRITRATPIFMFAIYSTCPCSLQTTVCIEHGKLQPRMEGESNGIPSKGFQA